MKTGRSLKDVTAHLMTRLREVQRELGFPLADEDAAVVRFADALDSMGMVEFLTLVAEDYGITPDAIEATIGHRFGTVVDLANALLAGGKEASPLAALQDADREARAGPIGWMVATTVRLPCAVEPAILLNSRLHRPSGWLEQHAGIEQRSVWAEQDPVAAAIDAGQACLQQAGLSPADVGGLLVTSEAPPLLVGIGAALHHGLRLPPRAAVLEIGGASCGFLSALWTALRLLHDCRTMLMIALEAPSRYLCVQPGLEGEAAALFGDAAAAALLCHEPRGPNPRTVKRVFVSSDGHAGSLARVWFAPGSGFQLQMQGIKLARRAVEAMAQSVTAIAAQAGLPLSELAGVVAHGGNGRMPALLARKLGLPACRIWSTVGRTGNLGSASLLAAWMSRETQPSGPVVWTAAGAGLLWGAALLED